MRILKLSLVLSASFVSAQLKEKKTPKGIGPKEPKLLDPIALSKGKKGDSKSSTPTSSPVVTDTSGTSSPNTAPPSSSPISFDLKGSARPSSRRPTQNLKTGTKAPTATTTNISKTTTSQPVKASKTTSPMAPSGTVSNTRIPSKSTSQPAFQPVVTKSPLSKPTSPVSKPTSSVSSPTVTATSPVTTVSIPEFSLELYFGTIKRRKLQVGNTLITQPFSGDSLLTSKVQTYLENSFQNIQSSSQLAFLRILSATNGSSTIYANIQSNLSIDKQWIATNYTGYSSFQGSQTPSSNDLGSTILNAFGQPNGQDKFLEILHSTNNEYLQQVTQIKVYLKNAPRYQEIRPANQDTSILAGTIIASAISLIFVAGTVYLIRRNRKKKQQYEEKVSFGQQPPLYIHIPSKDNTMANAALATTNIFDVAVVNTTCLNRGSGYIPIYESFQTIHDTSSGSRGSSSLEQILEENSCCCMSEGEEVPSPAVSASFAMSNTSFNSDLSMNQSMMSMDDEGNSSHDDSFLVTETHLINPPKDHTSSEKIQTDFDSDGVRATLGISPMSLDSSVNDDFKDSN